MAIRSFPIVSGNHSVTNFCYRFGTGRPIQAAVRNVA